MRKVEWEGVRMVEWEEGCEEGGVGGGCEEGGVGGRV